MNARDQDRTNESSVSGSEGQHGQLAPDTIFVGGSLFTAGWDAPRFAALAVADGRITAIGQDAEVRVIAGPGTRIIELDGGLLVPGFHDAHAHPVSGGIELLQVNLAGTENSDQAIAVVAEYAAAHPDEEWLVGAGWSMSHFPGGTPTAAALDAVIGARPAMLLNRDHHGAWVSSETLRRAGITRDTPDPVDGRIERDVDGNPTGTLHEGAMALVDGVRPPTDPELALRGLLRAQTEYFRQGIVGWQDAWVGATFGLEDLLAVYLTAVDRGVLTARVSAALWWERAKGMAQIDSLIARRDTVRGLNRPDIFSAETVKIMVDGVAENFTAAMAPPYLDSHGHPTDNSGITFLDLRELTEAVVALDAAGFAVHFHALGNRAVTIALDALEAARKANGASASRHHLAHLQVVDEADVPRFAELGATANLQMLWARLDDQLRDLTLPFLDESLYSRQYPFGDLVRAEAQLAAGSDWPVSSANPLAAIHVAVNRIDALKDSAPLGYPEQAIPLATALAAYTAGSATINGRGGYSGRLEVGYAADLAVLRTDPFVGAPSAIADTAVASTWINGTCVFPGRE